MIKKHLAIIALLALATAGGAQAQGSARTTGVKAANQTVDATNTTNVTSTQAITPDGTTRIVVPRLTGILGAAAVRDSAQTFSPGASCAQGPVQWGTSPNYCTATAALTPNGGSIMLLDNIAPVKGLIGLQCANGVWQGSSPTCGIPCPETDVSWTGSGPFSCTARLLETISAGFGWDVTASDVTPPTTGYADYACSSAGTWRLLQAARFDSSPHSVCDSSIPYSATPPPPPPPTAPPGVVYGVFRFLLGPDTGGPVQYAQGVGYYKPGTGQYRGHFYYEQLGITSIVPATDSCAYADASYKLQCIQANLCREIPLSTNVYGPLPYCNIYGGGYSQPGTIIMTKAPGTMPYNIVIAVDVITVYSVTTVIPMAFPNPDGSWATSPPAW